MSGKPSTITIIIIAMLVALGPMATDMYLPALPELTKVLNTTDSNTQLTLSVYFFGFAIGQLVYGPLSDRFGRKPVLQFGLLIFVISSVVASLATSIESLIIARLFQSLGGCAGPVLGRAMVRDMTPPEDIGQVLSHIASMMAIAPAVAPIIGSVLTVAYGWESNFWFLFTYGLIMLITLTLIIPESNTRKNPDAMKLAPLVANYKAIMHNRQWRLHTAMCSFVFAGLFSFLSGSSFVLIGYLGITEKSYGYLLAIITTGYFVGSQFSARFSKSFGATKLIQFGSVLALVSGFSMFLLSLTASHNVASIIGPQFFFMASVGIVMPQTMAGALAPFPHIAGSASALLGFTQMFMAAIFGAVIGYVSMGTPTVMAGGIALAGVLTFVSMTRMMPSRAP